MVNEKSGIVISTLIIIIGNLVKSDNIKIGDFIQGIGIGSGLGTIFHYIDKKYPNKIPIKTPHHDLTALVSMPIIFTLDKTNTIKNKTITNNLYGISIGMLTQHLLTEGCSFCRTYYCENDSNLC